MLLVFSSKSLNVWHLHVLIQILLRPPTFDQRVLEAIRIVVFLLENLILDTSRLLLGLLANGSKNRFDVGARLDLTGNMNVNFRI